MKTTKLAMFAKISTVIATMENIENRAEMLDFLAHEAELLTAKAEKAKSTPAKPSKSVEANNAVRQALLTYFAEQEEMKTIKELISEVAELEGASSQRVAQLLSPLVKEGKVKKDMVGKLTAYGLA